MKVVQINACYEYSSTGRTSFEMHRYLVDHGIESYKFYSMPMPNSDKGDLIGNWADHKLHALLSRIFGRQAYFSTFPTLKLIRKLRKIEPDIVILRNLHGNYINLRLLTKYLADKNIATIVVLHDCWFFTGYCCHYTEVGCQQWQLHCRKCPLIKKDRASWFVDSVSSVFEAHKKWFSRIPRLAVVGVSEWITNEGRKAPVFSNARIFRRIYNWINLNIFYPREDTSALRMHLGLSDTDFVALGVSMSWSFRKGLGVFLDLARRIPDIKIVLIGTVPDIDLPANVIVVPPTASTEELAQYYSMADVLLNFSIQETFGKVAAEALACGTPLVVNNATANPEIPGPCGFAVTNNDIDEVVAAVRTIKGNGKAHYCQDCTRRAQKLFDKDTNLAEYMDLFSRLVE